MGYLSGTTLSDLCVAPDWGSLKVSSGPLLPHWSAEKAIYHVCFRLADSVPASQRRRWLEERESLAAQLRTAHGALTEADVNDLRGMFSDKVNAYLDQGCGGCLLREAACAKCVADAVSFFDGMRYRLHAWCVMPNHVHVIVEPAGRWALGKIVHGWTCFTAKALNRILGRSGAIWQHEPYDHIIRSVREYVYQVKYVWENPDKAGITAPRWKSAIMEEECAGV
ncbi:MAG TPA: transposase [Kiritimatiellia bacterium]|nr:transposase [Kiritimatiellia bacterium]HPS06514.1 transposase [Kiritimatiellia bacterium]